MESGNCTTGNSYKQDREQISQCIIMKSGKCWQVHFRMCNQQTDNCSKDHSCKHKGCHIIPWLHQKPHRKHCCQKDIGKCKITPCVLGCCDRACHTNCKSCHCTYKSDYNLLPACQLELLLDQAKYNCKYNKQQRNASGRSIGLRSVRKL